MGGSVSRSASCAASSAAVAELQTGDLAEDGVRGTHGAYSLPP